MLKAKFFEDKNLLEVGCDEAGRGCLAGPVIAAAVILNPKNPIEGLNDSKKLSESKRKLLELEIKEKALYWAIGECSNKEIDEINILNASILAMHKAISKLNVTPEFILVDGNRFKKYGNINHICVVKGDAKYQSIAAASILAKTHRDHLMQKLHLEFPNYGWNTNKGYPAPNHIKALEIYKDTPFHRKSFKLKPKQLSLNL